ncbi:MAG: 50S ribosomal protein L39e [Aigarchaeota archaeon]|nr:50S ribosomal protein L39e [Aigarchaeota archaeon]MDW8092986.1 50S ribosomal protein L39e [Nitrososphaerota archaeon]
MAKTLPVKKRLSSALKRSSAVPAWVMARTRRRVTRSNRQRNWRRSSSIKP